LVNARYVPGIGFEAKNALYAVMKPTMN